jgi:tellurite resistance-related uncharacterized protein
MKQLPDSVTAYKRTPTFNNDSVPKGLLQDHNTKAGTWGKITIIEGSILYTILEPTVEEYELSPGVDGIVEPTVHHKIALREATTFYVEFYR